MESPSEQDEVVPGPSYVVVCSLDKMSIGPVAKAEQSCIVVSDTDDSDLEVIARAATSPPLPSGGHAISQRAKVVKKKPSAAEVQPPQVSKKPAAFGKEISDAIKGMVPADLDSIMETMYTEQYQSDISRKNFTSNIYKKVQAMNKLGDPEVAKEIATVALRRASVFWACKRDSAPAEPENADMEPAEIESSTTPSSQFSDSD